MGMYYYFIYLLFNIFIIYILHIVHFCYFQNTFPFVSMSKQTDDIGKTSPTKFVEQSIDYHISRARAREIS